MKIPARLVVCIVGGAVQIACVDSGRNGVDAIDVASETSIDVASETSTDVAMETSTDVRANDTGLVREDVAADRGPIIVADEGPFECSEFVEYCTDPAGAPVGCCGNSDAGPFYADGARANGPLRLVDGGSVADGCTTYC